MSAESEPVCLCPLKGVIDVISKKWALLTINALGHRGKLRFNELMAELRGISPKTLSDTLKGLYGERLITRESFAEIPPRVEYSLTENGKELRKAVVPLLRWAAKRTSFRKAKCVPSYCKMSAHKMDPAMAGSASDTG